MRYVLYTVTQVLGSVWKKLSRQGLRLLLSFASEEKKIAAERRLRGRDQFNKLAKADFAVVSFGKSGRTWLRVMLSRVYQQKYHLPERVLLGFDNLHHMNPQIPRIFFTHDNYIKDYTGGGASKAHFYPKKVVLLVRDPRDVAVSQFFQWKYRMRPEKKSLNQYPEHDVPVFDFVMTPGAGLPKVIAFMNEWAAEIPRLKRFMLLRYEDLRAHPEAALQRLMDFLDVAVTQAEIDAAVAFASYDNMKKMEQKRVFWLSGGRLVPRDRQNPDSYKVRRAKVGGYRDYFTDQQLQQIDELIAATLAPVFGYGGAVKTANSASQDSHLAAGS